MENLTEILEMANKCLNCKNAPCKKACPMETKIPEFIAKIKEEKFDEAYDILIENNPFSSICGVICPRERQCEGSCVRGIKGEPTSIGKLERFVNNWAKENNYTYEQNMEESIDKKVAIIGSGPAGITCAIELAKRGIKSVIFEKEKEFGGILRYGIPDFRLDKNLLDNIIENTKSMGVEFKSNIEFGKDITIDSLKQEGFSAIFVGIGAEIPSTYELSNEKYSNIYKPDYFLKRYNEGEFIKDLGVTVVIGGGNVAMDCARTAIKMGARKVYVLYRRDRKNMPATNVEIEDAIADGVEFEYQTKVIKAFGENGILSEIECIKTDVVDGKAVDIEGSNFKMKIDSFVFAIGLTPNEKLLKRQGIETENGLVKIDEFGTTCIEGVFSGGDTTEYKSSVCKAVAAGKTAAIGIEKYIKKT